MSEDAAAMGTDSTTERVKDQVAERTEVARGKARGRLREQVDQRSTQAGERLGSTATDVRGVAEELRRQGKEGPARMVEQVAGQADRAADYLKTASGDRILRDVEDLARSKPWAVVAGGLAVGFAASRFLKASSGRRYQESQAGYPATVRTTTYTTDAAVATYPAEADATTTYPAGVPVVGTYDPDPADPDVRVPRAE
jgi:ElaB/YqjD/DUF883 family membrane-anchored ribosome-binding protein